MLDGRGKWGMAAWALLAAAPAAAQEVAAETVTAAAATVPAAESAATPERAELGIQTALLAPLQGSRALRASFQAPVEGAVQQALTRRGYEVLSPEDGAGQRLVDCPTPECVEQTLEHAGAAFAIVPALWSRSSGPDELTLTLVPRAGRGLNVSGAMEGDLTRTGARLVHALLEQRAVFVAYAAAPDGLAPSLDKPSSRLDHSPSSEPGHPHAWKVGPVMLLAVGMGSFVAVGVAAGVKGEDQQLNGAAVGAWSAIGAAAIAGGLTWWLVGERRRADLETGPVRRAAVGLHPTRIDLRLWF